MFETMKAKALAAGVGLTLLGSAAVGGITLVGAQTNTTPNAPPATESGVETPQAAESNVEPANEPQLPGGGHADPEGLGALGVGTHDFQGVE